MRSVPPGASKSSSALLTSSSLAKAHEQNLRLGACVLAADMPETDRLWATVDA